MPWGLRKAEDSRLHPFLRLGTGSRFLHQRRDRSRIRPAGDHQAGRCVPQAVDVEVRGRTALGRHWGFGPVELRPPGAGKLESARLLSFVVRF